MRQMQAAQISEGATVSCGGEGDSPASAFTAGGETEEGVALTHHAQCRGDAFPIRTHRLQEEELCSPGARAQKNKRFYACENAA